MSFTISPEKQDQLLARMAKIGLREADIEESFIRGSGSGGQKINKTSSCVQLVHRPSGIEIKCQRDRSQAMNRFHARRELCERLEERIEGARSARQQEHEKIRRTKRKRSQRSKARMLEAKRARGETKQNRARPQGE
jgi:protein subunit release factor B